MPRVGQWAGRLQHGLLGCGGLNALSIVVGANRVLVGRSAAGSKGASLFSCDRATVPSSSRCLGRQ
jgi:hypothetical protein